MELRRTKAWINGLCLTALLTALLARNQTVSTVLIVVCCFATMILLYRNLAKLSNVSEDNPKVKSLRFVTFFTVGYVVLLVGISVGAEKLAARGLLPEPTPRQAKLLMALLLAIPMAVLGNVCPKLPFNRYTGLRLPWTVRDEQTWLVAHRILGWISVPLALLLFLQVPTPMRLDDYVKYWFLGIGLLWIGIPGLISGVFYYRKFSGKQM